MAEFTQVLGTIEQGGLVVDLDKELRDLVLACQAQMKKGKLVVEFVVEPKGQDRQGNDKVFITGALKVTKPPVNRAATVFFTNQEGDLDRTPFKDDQMPLPGLRVAEGGKQ